MGGGATPRREFGGKVSNVRCVNTVCMCVRSEVLGGDGGREAKESW